MKRELWLVTSNTPLFARYFELTIFTLSAIFLQKTSCQIPTMSFVSDLVQVSKLETQFHSDPEYTQHVHNVSGSTPKQRRVRKEEKWRRERELGRGAFGVVGLQRCIQGDSEGKVRAVKKVPKRESSNYHRELEAIALFSHSKARLLLLSIPSHHFYILC